MTKENIFQLFLLYFIFNILSVAGSVCYSVGSSTVKKYRVYGVLYFLMDQCCRMSITLYWPCSCLLGIFVSIFFKISNTFLSNYLRWLRHMLLEHLFWFYFYPLDLRSDILRTLECFMCITDPLEEILVLLLSTGQIKTNMLYWGRRGGAQRCDCNATVVGLIPIRRNEIFNTQCLPNYLLSTLQCAGYSVKLIWF